MKLTLSLSRLVSVLEPLRVEGETKAPLTRIASLKDAQEGDISFLSNMRYRSDLRGSGASVILVPADLKDKPPTGCAYLYCENPSAALALICHEAEQLLRPRPLPGIHPTAAVAPDSRVDAKASVGPLCVVESGAVLGPGSVLEAQVFVGRESSIGEDSWLMPGVRVMAGSVIGSRVRLHPGAVIGADGFGYDSSPDGHRRIPHAGIVVVEDDVEIGSNTTVDRARFDKTLIGRGTKIDNLVQIAHNVKIGRHCLVVSQVGIAGSTILEDFVVVGGQAGLNGHIRIGSGSKIGGQTGVPADLEPGSVVWDTPAMPLMLAQKVAVLKKRLPDLFRKVSNLENEVKKLSAHVDL